MRIDAGNGASLASLQMARKPGTPCRCRRLIIESRLCLVYLAVAWVLAASTGCLSPVPGESAWALRRLHADLDAIFDEPKYANAFWGVRIERPDGRVLYERLAGKEFAPASNLKLFTSAAALELLGPDFAYETRLEALGTISTEGVLDGDLVIVGSGDPSLGAWHPDESRGSLWLLSEWVRRIREAGIRRIDGDIIGDGRCFTPDCYSPNWNYGDLPYWYATGTSGLAIEENCFRCVIRPGANVGDPASIEVNPRTDYIQVINQTRTVEAGGPNTADSTWQETEGNTVRFVGTIAMDKEAIHERGSVWDGPRYAAFLLAEALDREGIEVTGEAVNARSLPDAGRIDGVEPARRKVLATIVSPPLRELIKVINKPSHNFFADQILRTLGARRGEAGSFEAGARVVREWLKTIGVAQPETIQMYDGSGLARDDFVQPRQVCDLLRYMRQSEKTGPPFIESLPIGGGDGTLSERLRDPVTNGRVRAKTGYISNVRALSGYIIIDGRDELVFSMICNQYTVPTREVNASQDQACRVMIDYVMGG